MLGIPHKQVDSGLGFECDEGIVELIRIFNQVPRIKTQFSCQGGDGEDAQVLFIGELLDLLSFCNSLRPLLSDEDYSSGQDQYGVERFSFDWLKILFQPDNFLDDGTNYGGIRGELTFAASQVERVTRIIEKLVFMILPCSLRMNT